MRRVSQKKAARGSTRDDVEHALADWLDEYAWDRTHLSAWESYCFATVLTLLRYGYYQRALDQLACVIEPPTPLPMFPMHQLMSLDQLLGDLPPGVAERRRAANETAECDQGAGPSR